MLKGFNLKRFALQNSALIALIFLVIVATIMQGTTFLSFTNIVNILRNNAIIGIVAIGMTFVIIMGGIDLSVGSQLALLGYIVIDITNKTGSVLLGLLSGVAVSVLFGIFTGALVAKCKIPSFIVTLGTMTIYRSVAQFFLNGGGIMVTGSAAQHFIAISNTNVYKNISLYVIFWIILTVVMQIFASRVPLGRHIYAVGSNEKATKLSGINTDKVMIIGFIICSLMVCFASIVEASRLGSINSASSGRSYEMDAIAAAVIGGTSMSGGRGTIIGTFIGTLIMGVINNMMNLVGIPPFLVGAVKGLIIIAAVLFQKYLDGKQTA